MYSVLGTPEEEQFVVRCVPPEMVQVDQPEAAPEDPTAPPEVRELSLDRRMRASLRNITDRKGDIQQLAAWTQQAPCDALPEDAKECGRMRFTARQAGGRCIQTLDGACQDNLAEVQRKVDRASTQLMRLVRRMKSKLYQLQKGTGEESIDEALHLVARGMEDQVYAQHVCNMHQAPEDCNAEEQAHCRFENGQCQTYSCRSFHTQGECKQEAACNWNANAHPATCESAMQCNDHRTQLACGQVNECMWDGSNGQCISGIAAVRHIIDVANMAEAQHAKGGMLNEILISQVHTDRPWPERQWTCRDGNCRTTTEGGTSRTECQRSCSVQNHSPKKPYQHYDRVKENGLVYYATQDVPRHTKLTARAWKTQPVRGGGLSGPRLGKLVRLMTRIMQQYHTLRQWTPKLRELMPTYRAAVQLDATCTPGNANCQAQRHRMTEGVTWAATAEHGRAALPPAHFPQEPPPFEEPALQLR
jgi:hypothetical protein